MDLTTGQLSAPVLAAEDTMSNLATFGRVAPGRADALCAHGKGARLSTPQACGRGARVRYLLRRRVRRADARLSQCRGHAAAAPLAHVNVDQSGRVAVAISYHASEVSSFPILADGRLGPRASLLTHGGTLGPNAKRQEKHAPPLAATFSPDNRFVYVCDLGPRSRLPV